MCQRLPHQCIRNEKRQSKCAPHGLRFVPAVANEHVTATTHTQELAACVASMV